MGIKVQWDDVEQRIVAYVFDTSWTWPELVSAVREAKALIDTAPGNVGTIFCSTARFPVPAPNFLSNARKELRDIHPKNKIMVVVTESAFIHAVMDIAFKIAGVKASFKIMTQMDEARALIREHLATLDQQEKSPL